MNGLKVRPVLTGSVIDIFGSLILGGVFFAVLGSASGTASAEELSRMYDSSPQLQLATISLGLVMTAIGAYVAALLAKGSERLHAFAVGVVSTVTGFTIVFAAPETSPFWSQAASLILTIPAAFVGGEIRRTLAGRRKSAS